MQPTSQQGQTTRPPTQPNPTAQQASTKDRPNEQRAGQHGQGHTPRFTFDPLIVQLRSTPSVQERATMVLQSVQDQLRNAGDGHRNEFLDELDANRVRLAQAIAG